MEMVNEVRDNIMSGRSAVLRGDITRIAHRMKRAMQGAPLSLGFIGGSITHGSTASSFDKCYVNLVADWWRRKYPLSAVSVINAGIPGTGSLIGVHRVDRDVLIHKPDFVCVEFAVNDSGAELAETYDSMVRKILLSEKLPGVMLIHMTNDEGGGAEAMHSLTGAQYDLPMVSFRSAVWPEIESGRLKWADFEVDTVHPNDYGYSLVAKFITDRLDEIHEFALMNDVPQPPDHIAEPLNGDWFKDAKMMHSDVLKPVSYGGWETDPDTPMFGPGWKAVGLGDPMIFNVECRNVGIIYNWTSNGTMGRISVDIDGCEPLIINAHARASAVARGVMLFKHMPSEIHRLSIKLCEESSPGSTGRDFQICAVLTS